MSDKVAIITGGARGIGLACSRQFFEDGYRIVIADSNEAAGLEALEAIGVKDKRQGIFVPCDVGEKLSIHNLIAETLSHFGHINTLINNAGVALKGGILSLSESDFDRVMDVNLRGAFLLSKAVTKHMVERINNSDDRSGLMREPMSIINMSSINANMALPDYIAYCMSKGGLKQMTKSMALELAPYGIRVNSIEPGSIKTDMLAGVAGDEEAYNTIMMRTPMGRIGRSEEVASVAAFLASENASYITGESIVVDGGRMALNYIMPLQSGDED